MKQLTINLFRDPAGGYRISTYRVEPNREPERIATRRDPPTNIASVGFWIDIRAPEGTLRQDFLQLLDQARETLSTPTNEPSQTLWSSGRATITLACGTISVGGGLFADWAEYLRRFDLAAAVLRDAPEMNGLDN